MSPTCLAIEICNRRLDRLTGLQKAALGRSFLTSCASRTCSVLRFLWIWRAGFEVAAAALVATGISSRVQGGSEVCSRGKALDVPSHSTRFFLDRK